MDKEKQTVYRGNRWIGRRPQHWLKRGNDVWYVLTRDYRLRMERKPFRGTFCKAAIHRKRLPGERVPRLVREKEWPNMRKIQPADKSSVKHLADLETKMFRQHFAIVEHLAVLQYDDGTPRSAGRLIIDVRGAAWCVLCKDPDSGMQLSVVGVTLDDALDALAVHLGSENAPWEPDPWAKGQGARKGKK